MESVALYAQAELRDAPASAGELGAAAGYGAGLGAGALAAVVQDLKETQENLVRFLLGRPEVQLRWVDAYFPFTAPSFELEALLDGRWVEMLGCGVIHGDVLRRAGRDPHHLVGWAAGIGVERFAMLCFGIPDIRLFWSRDERFLGQFALHKVSAFAPFSRYAACYKDFSFWSPAAAAVSENDVVGVVRELAGDLVEEVRRIDTYREAASGRTSLCYRVNYRSLERTLGNAEVDALQTRVRRALEQQLGLQLR